MEMEQALWEEAPEQEEEWGVEEVEQEWAAIVPEQAPVAIVYVLNVGQKYLIKQEFLVIL